MGKLLPICMTLMLLLAACGGDDPTSEAPQGSEEGDHGMDMGGEGFAFGEPGDRSEPERTFIDISALDSLEFDPDSVEVELGETARS